MVTSTFLQKYKARCSVFFQQLFQQLQIQFLASGSDSKITHCWKVKELIQKTICFYLCVSCLILPKFKKTNNLGYLQFSYSNVSRTTTSICAKTNLNQMHAIDEHDSKKNTKHIDFCITTLIV